MKAFASDNYSGVHPEIMEALTRANTEHMGSYGNDEITERTKHLLRKSSEPAQKFSLCTTEQAPMW
jgi:threonine aldolase